MNDDFTFIIQGVYSPIHHEMISSLKSFGKVILSCYKNDYSKIEQQHLNFYDNIIFNELIENPDQYGIYNHQNVYRQSYSTLSGLKHVETKYAIKFRSDMYVSNIEYLLETVINNSQKLSISPFTSDAYCMLSFGDQIVAGTKENLVNTYETAYNFAKTINFDDPSTYMYDDMDLRSGAENFFSISHLKSKNLSLGYPVVVTYWMESFKRPNVKCYVNVGTNYETVILNNFFLFDTEKLWPYYYKSNAINHVYTEESCPQCGHSYTKKTCPHRPISIEDYIVKFKKLHNIHYV